MKQTDWLFAACLEYIILFSIDSSEARKQYDEYCLSIMQTITYGKVDEGILI
jgi:ribose 5-phosphate isomerase RpiB